jgi:hypothetical protein
MLFPTYFLYSFPLLHPMDGSLQAAQPVLLPLVRRYAEDSGITKTGSQKMWLLVRSECK